MYYVLFNSVTLASRVKNHFRFTNERVSMMHTPAGLSRGGCSYSLVVEPHLVNEVLKVAKEYGIAVKGVYEQTSDGFGEVKYDISG